MIWHIVRFDFGGIDEVTRAELETQLAGLDHIAEVGFLRLARDLQDEDITGLITGFASADDLAAYRVHPDHVPVVEAIRGTAAEVVRLDIHTDDDVTALP